MAINRQKISQMTPKGADLDPTDLMEVSVDTGTGYETRSITGQEIINGLSGNYVPYTGATQDVDLDANKLSAESIYIEGTNGDGHLHLKHQNADATATGQSTALWANNDGDIKWKNDNDYKTTLKTSLNTADRVYTFPDADCTLVPDSRTITINGTTQNLSSNITFTISTGLTVGTTPVTSGTDGRVFFQAGGVVQQDAAFFWDNTNKRLGVGATPSTSVRLDIRAQGALSTDVAFRVRNSVDTANIITVLGTNDVYIGPTITQAGQGHLFNIRNAGSTSIPFAYFDNNSYNFDVDRFCNIKLGFGLIAANSTQSLALGLGTLPSSRNFQQTVGILTAISQGTNDSGIAMSGADTSGNNAIYTNYYGRNIVLGGTTQGTGTRKIVLNNGTAPSTNLTDSFQLYSADRGGVAGKSSAHFRAEDGTINVIGDLSGFGTSLPGARLDVRAQGALSTDIAFRVRNSADSLDIISIAGESTFNIGTTSGGNYIQNSSSGLDLNTNGKDIRLQSSSRVRLTTNSTLRAFMSQQGNLIFSNSLSSDPASMVGGIAMYNLTAPTGNITDGFSMYSADIVTGNAAPHFRTETGDVIKLYKETTAVTAATIVGGAGTNITDTDTFDGYTVSQVVKALKNLGILA